MSGSVPATRWSAGISWRHGWHHVAQKFTTTTFPREAERRRVCPVGTLYSKSGAYAPIRPAIPSPSICARITPTFVGPVKGWLKGSAGHTRAASDARAIAPMMIAASHRGSAVGRCVTSALLIREAAGS